MAEPSPGALVRPQGPFSLSAAGAFLGAFAPAGTEGLQADGSVAMAFGLDGHEGPGGAVARATGDGVEIVGSGADPGAARVQAVRILGLDVDARPLTAIAARDAVVAALVAARPGLRPVLFGTPYEAAAWAVLSSRSSMAQAARTRARLVAEHGEEVRVAGRALRAFPGPDRLLALSAVPGAGAQRLGRLHAVAAAAREGWLDAARLRALDPTQASAEVREVHGLGPFAAELVLVRGAGLPDLLPAHEPRARQAAARAYGLPGPPDDAEWTRLGEAWRPLRAWIAFLLRAAE